MFYWPRLIGLLLAGPHRVNAAGEINLTPAEAGMLRAAGFQTAAPGPWRIPPIPTWVAFPEYLSRLLPQLVRERATVTQPTSTPPPRPPRYAGRPPGDSRTDVRIALGWRLADTLRDVDQRRLLEALAGRPDGPVECRRVSAAEIRCWPASSHWLRSYPSSTSAPV